MVISESIKDISAALINFQKTVVQPKKTSVNPFHKSKYAPLDSIIEAIKEPLAENNLSYTQSIVSSAQGVGVETMIVHSSGQYIIHNPFYLPLQQQTPQGGASASTYARRYSLCAAFGIAPEDDDDGNFASEQKQTKKMDF
jgi:hypothetical protein